MVERKQGNDWYLIDKETGEKATGFQRLEEQAKTVYYNNEGKMQYGWQWVNNATHYFDTFNGAMAIGEKNINGHWYLFNEQGQMQRGFQTLENSDEKKTVYYNKDGWMLYGWQWVNNATHYFDMFNGAMATGEKISTATGIYLIDRARCNEVFKSWTNMDKIRLFTIMIKDICFMDNSGSLINGITLIRLMVR